MERPNDPLTPPGWGQPVRALFTPCAQPLWRPFWLLLALALALRLLAAWHGHWLWRVDEAFQYLEQAHRVVFGYGTIPWEYRYGTRNWLTAGMAMPPLFAAKWLGIDHPWAYATMVNIWNALLSMSIPVSTYFIARRMLSEQAARWALVFTCFWYEFIILAPRTLSEIYGTYFFMAGLALAAGTSRKTWLYAGFLLGMAISIRVTYGMVVGIVAVAGLWHLPRRCAIAAVLGGVAALSLWGLVDKLTWGGWWASIFNFLEYEPILIPDEGWGELVFLRYTISLAVASCWLYPAALLLALSGLRRLWLVWLLVAIPLFLHHFHSPQEYSNVFILLPLLWMMTAGTVIIIGNKSKNAFRLVMAGISVVSLAGILGALPGQKSLFRTTDFFSTAPAIQSAYQAHDFINRQDKTVLVWEHDYAGLPYGGYYTLHHNIPVLYLSFHNVRDKHHHKIWEETGFLPLQSLATHIVTARGRVDFGAENLLLADGHVIYAVEKPPTHDIKDKWVYDYFNPGLDEKGLLPAAELTPYNPQW